KYSKSCCNKVSPLLISPSLRENQNFPEMAISPLLHPKPRGLHFNARGLIRSTNCYSFSSFSSGGSQKFSFLKGLKASKGGKAGDKEPQNSSRIEDLMKVINREKSDPTAGEMAGILRDSLASTESSKGNKIEKEKNSDLSEIMNYLPGNRTATSVQRPSATIISGKKHASSKSFSRIEDLMKVINREKNDPTAGEMAGILHDTLAPTESSKGNKIEKEKTKSHERKILNSSDVERSHTLLESTIKDWERTILNVTDQLSKNVWGAANLRNSDVKRRHTLLKHHMSSGNISLDIKKESSIPTESISDKEDSNLDLANSGHVKSGPNSHVSLPVSREELNHSQTCFLSKEGYKDDKELVRFLTKNVKKLNILAAFSDCGLIVKVEELSSTKESSFKDFLVHFKTREGSQLALKKNDVMVMETEAFVEPTTSEDTAGAIISIPDPISDPEAPTALLKNPTTAAEGNRRCQREALAQQSVLVSGKELLILRIDAPRTTVVRISNIKPTSKAWTICNSYGQVKYLAKKGVGVVDVHFKLAEWPNMLNIVNK
ncbi:hypothetical protein ES319_D10G174200v1, partial [Gossypium barbadense]